MQRYRRTIVVGAGPAGSACALSLARSGRHEVVLVERAEVRREKACAGGVSPRALALLGRLGVRERLTEGALPMRLLRLVGRDGSEQILDGGALAVIQRRALFDERLVEEAERAGARLEAGRHVDRLLRRRGGVLGVGAGDWELEGDVVVLAGGAHCGLSWDPRPRLRLDGVIARYEGYEAMDQTAEFAFVPEVTPHYVWLFPEPGGTTNVGFCRPHRPGQRPVHGLFEELVDRHFPKLRGASRVGRIQGHPIVYSPSARFLVGQGALVAGEAGRLTDGFTGEGIWHALRSGVEAAAAIEAEDLERYGWRCRMVFDPVLRTSLALAQVARTPLFDWATRAASAPPVQWLVGHALAAAATVGSTH